MLPFVTLSLLFAIAAERAYGIVLPTTTRAAPVGVGYGPPVLTAAPSYPQGHDLLLARQPHTGYVCGRGYGNFSVTCNEHTLNCAGQLVSDGNAYQYCSTPGVANQFIATTAYSYGEMKSCPDSAWCCESTAPNVQVDLYVASSDAYTYTVTGFECQNVSTTSTWNPALNILDPRSFSVSLLHLTSSTTTSTTSSSLIITSTSSSTSPTPTSNNGGMPEGEKIGLGVGLGVGIFGVGLVAAAIWLLSPWLCGRKRKS